tara:strand:+ start:27 stop:893 length:867 start_codon:yes stop_codon:yes gene_type:complete
MSRARDTADQINRVNSSAADATAITVDSSENVLVGKTSSSTTTAGNELRAGGLAAFTRSGSYSLNLNRLASDGDIAVFQKDNTTVGSIGATGGKTFIYGGSGSVANLNFGSTSVVYPSSDAVGDVGASSHRFRDAYLSGGVYLGGTGAANKLDDYEEGTWTPTAVFSGGGSPIYARQLATYTKIGRFVFCDIAIIFQKNNGSGSLSIENFPFSNTSGNDRGCASFGYFSGTNGIPIGMIGSGNAKCDIRTALNSTSYNDDLNGNQSINNGFLDAETNFHFSITYKTDA